MNERSRRLNYITLEPVFFLSSFPSKVSWRHHNVISLQTKYSFVLFYSEHYHVRITWMSNSFCLPTNFGERRATFRKCSSRCWHCQIFGNPTSKGRTYATELPPSGKMPPNPREKLHEQKNIVFGVVGVTALLCAYYLSTRPKERNRESKPEGPKKSD